MVDYNSSDLTLNIVSKILANSAINLIKIHCGVAGKSPALVLGLDAARGDYIVIVDDDNILYSNSSDFSKRFVLDCKLIESLLKL